MEEITELVNRSLGARHRARREQRRFSPYPTPPNTSERQMNRQSGRQPASNTSRIPTAVIAVMENAWAPATRQRYEANVKEFTVFCNTQKIPETDRLPASEMLLATFAASLVGKCAGSTAQGKVAALKAWHIRNNVPWRGNTLLDYVLKGLERASPGNAKQTRRPPITIQMIEQLYNGLDRTKPLDIAVLATATTAFYGQLRLGEICAKREAYSTFNPKTHSMRKDLLPPHTEAGSRILVIPWTKVKRTRGEEVVITRQRGITDPIAALERHLQINEITEPTTALMSYSTGSGRRKLLTTSKFIQRCNEIWKAHGHKRITGHSFRIGGTTHYLLNKVHPDVVRALGRWSSNAFFRYWRQLDVLATMHTELMQLQTNRRR
jgi:hypothetical protein